MTHFRAYTETPKFGNDDKGRSDVTETNKCMTKIKLGV